jgi:hypothetical protein
MYGSGRVAVIGEAAIFSAQVPEASRNAQFLLNVVHWLTGLLGGD